MDNGFSNEPMLDIFIYETTQNIEQLEELILASEKESSFSPDAVNEIFRIMHTIKGSSSMMLFNNLASLAHAVEDLFYCLREEKPESVNYALLSDLVLEGADFIKQELEKVKNAGGLDGDPSGLIEKIKAFLSSIKSEKQKAALPAAKPDVPFANQATPAVLFDSPPQKSGAGATGQKGYEAVFYFEDGCEMENIRAYAILQDIKAIAEDFSFYPEDILENNDTVQVIREQGFRVQLVTERSLAELHNFFINTPFVRDLELTEMKEDQAVQLQAAPDPASIQAPLAKAPKNPEREQASGGQA